MTRDEVIKEIRSALRRRSGRSWSVTGGRGTAWGWIRINVPPALRTSRAVLKAGAVTSWPEDYEEIDTGELGGDMTKADRSMLGDLLGLPGPVHRQGGSIPPDGNYYEEYVDRANGRKPAKCGKIYGDKHKGEYDN